jgi:hypothetical protein
MHHSHTQAFTKVNIPLFILQYLTVIIGLISYLVPAIHDGGNFTVSVPACQVRCVLAASRSLWSCWRVVVTPIAK